MRCIARRGISYVDPAIPYRAASVPCVLASALLRCMAKKKNLFNQIPRYLADFDSFIVVSV